VTGRTERRKSTAVVPVNELERQQPVVLASGNEAVAGIADRLMKMTPNQRTFLRVRFYYESDAECARAVGIPIQTVKAWKKKPEFEAVYRDLLTQPILHARAELVLATNKAIDTVIQLMDRGNNPNVRLAAAEKILKSRDSQLLTNNLKVESDDGEDLYLALMQRLRTRSKGVRVVEEPPADAVEAEYSEVPADSKDGGRI
jgi:hypothetical protein